MAEIPTVHDMDRGRSNIEDSPRLRDARFRLKLMIQRWLLCCSAALGELGREHTVHAHWG
jgi:hypothetical protein